MRWRERASQTEGCSQIGGDFQIGSELRCSLRGAMKRLAPLVIVLGALLIAVAWWWNVSAVGSDDAATESSVVALDGPAGAKHGGSADHVRSMDDGDASGTAAEHATAHEHPDEMPLAAKSLVISASEKVLKDGGAANAS